MQVFVDSGKRALRGNRRIRDGVEHLEEQHGVGSTWGSLRDGRTTMLMSGEQYERMQKAGSAARAGKMFCDKCYRRLKMLWQICECGGHGTFTPKGCVQTKDEEQAVLLGQCSQCGYVGNANEDPCPVCIKSGDWFWIWPFPHGTAYVREEQKI